MRLCRKRKHLDYLDLQQVTLSSFCALWGAMPVTWQFAVSSPLQNSHGPSVSVKSEPLTLSCLFCPRIPGNGTFLKTPDYGERHSQLEGLQTPRLPPNLFTNPPGTLLWLARCVSEVIDSPSWLFGGGYALITPMRPSADNALKNHPIKTRFSSSDAVWVWFFFSQEGRWMKAIWGLLERCLILSSTKQATFVLCVSEHGKQVGEKIHR